ncbi:MAG: hypothetical protein QHJ81_06605 [Anaerolineae bacterium]|nr:hypothetical protein [Anaerolineae bacterium]
MTIITKQVELTPRDVIEALRGFEQKEWAEVLAFLEAEAPDIRPRPAPLGELEPHPEEPPRTPEGNRIALAAVERMAGMIPISDPELARWLAESR